MLNILCPTDFSSHAKRALDYAVQLSNLMDAQLHLITAYQVPSKAGSLIKMDETIEHNRIEDLNAISADITPDITTDYAPIIVAHQGSAPRVIKNYASHHDIDLVVMGTQGDGNAINVLFGSVTRKVGKKLKVPLLAVPTEAAFEKLEGSPLLFALDSKQVKKEKKLKIIKELVIGLKTKVDVLHIAKEIDDMLVDPFVLKYLDDYIGEVVIRKSLTPLIEINQYLRNTDAGMLIMIRRKKGFFKNLFLKGFTEVELGLTETPLLVLPG